MRDPERIDGLLKRLGKAWRASPDLRLGQLLLNVTGDAAPALFYVEDEPLIEAVERDAANWRELAQRRLDNLNKRLNEIQAKKGKP